VSSPRGSFLKALLLYLALPALILLLMAWATGFFSPAG
jgi:hypothetical protein